MKKTILICLFVFISCEHFSVFEKTQENVFFFKNNRTIESQFSGQLSIATFNIQMGFCQNCTPFSGEIGGGYEELDRIVNLINSLDIDIVSLQEVGLDYDVSIIQNQIEYIANKTNMNYAYGMGIAVQYLRNPFVNGLLGNAILSKYEIIDLENPRIRFIDYYVQNHCLKATIKLDEETEVVVLNSHFWAGSTMQENNNQITEITNLVNQEDRPYIFAGDLNIGYDPDSDFMLQLNQNFNNSFDLISSSERENILEAGTFFTGAVIDYVFTDKTHFNIQSGTLAPIEARDISDHYLYLVTMNKISENLK